ncbi:hypothetical protein B0H63DRAFT_506858 [Podospora didyma]|uniref:Ricin B lectin domain-containing protein n=1 Tax=Podospora didyma TaxID=330526 RepID=A0AAE0NWW3_9PEZI|nr:hypothetical protein B0H63DRAFT_506858 [Podospora didyma]
MYQSSTPHQLSSSLQSRFADLVMCYPLAPSLHPQSLYIVVSPPLSFYPPLASRHFGKASFPFSSIMAASGEHDSPIGATDLSTIFPNDETSQNVLATRRKQQQEAAAAALKAEQDANAREEQRVAREKAAEKEIAALKSRAEGLDDEVAALKRKTQDLSNDATTAKQQKTQAETQSVQDRARLETEMAKLKQEKSDADASWRNTCNNLESHINELRNERDRELAQKLDPSNNLDVNYDGQEVYIINIKARTTADHNPGTSTPIVRSWTWEYRNPNQRFVLDKVNRNDPRSPWYIRNHNTSRYWEFREAGSDKDLYAADRRGDYDGSLAQQWHICLSSGGSVLFKNVRFGTSVDLYSTENGKRGERLRSYDVRPEDPCQRFTIFHHHD